jgi:hypothetical protein
MPLWGTPMLQALVAQHHLDTGDPVDLAFLRLVLRGLEDNTRRKYNSHWRRFTGFCTPRGLCPLPASPSTVYRYIAFLSAEGRVASGSLGGYLSAINTVHRDCLLPPPVPDGDHVLARLTKGYAKTETIAAAGALHVQPVAFPAEWLWRILLLGRATTELPLRRAAAAVALTFATMMRSDTCTSLRREDLSIFLGATDGIPCVTCGGLSSEPVPILLCDRCNRGYHLDCLDPPLADLPAGGEDALWFCPSCADLSPSQHHPPGMPGLVVLQWVERRLKGKNHKTSRRLARLDLCGCLELANLLDLYLSDSAHAWAATGSPSGPGDLLWRLPGETEDPEPRALEAWLQLCLGAAGLPVDGRFTPHSLRRGGASAAHAVGVSLVTIASIGGWSRTSTALVTNYIDGQYPPTTLARALYSVYLS